MIFLLLSTLCLSLPIHSQDYISNELTSTVAITKSPLDLEKAPQDFILETKQLEFEGLKGAFNPSITRYKEKILMAVRTRDQKTLSSVDGNSIVLIWLNENFELISAPQRLYIPPHSKRPHIQDPRLITVEDRLFMVFSDTLPGVIMSETRRMVIMELHLVDGLFTPGQCECLIHFDGEKELRWEKNWTPFAYNDELLLSYSLLPHKIFYPIWDTQTCEMIATSSSSIHWDFGVLRGGTQALLEGDEYLAFFHSSKNMTSLQSQGNTIQHYFMGAYTFSAKPPFEITRISPEPIIGKNFYNGPAHKTWKPLRVVFPGGFIKDDNYIWIAYGRQDHEIWMAKLDKKGLLNSLIPVKSTP